MHLKYPEPFLRNLFEILNYNGVLILSVPNSLYEVIDDGKNKDSFHLNIFEYDKLVMLIESVGFTIENVYGQSYINKIVNGEISKTYSYIFVLKKLK